MNERNPVDAAAPWTIKSISVATREAVTKAARREGLTVGQWLERRVAEWEADGSPVPVGSTAPAKSRGDLREPLDLAGLAQLLGALGTLPESGLRRDAERTTRAVLRQARGLAPRRTRLLAPRKSP